MNRGQEAFFAFLGASIIRGRELSKDFRGSGPHVLVEVLGRIGSPAVESLISLLKAPHPGFRASVVEALGETRDNRAVEAITESLKDPDEHVRKEAERALRKIQDHSTGPSEKSDRDRLE